MSVDEKTEMLSAESPCCDDERREDERREEDVREDERRQEDVRENERREDSNLSPVSDWQSVAERHKSEENKSETEEDMLAVKGTVVDHCVESCGEKKEEKNDAPASPLTTTQQTAVPSPTSSSVRPKTGRAKTNAELKKQLLEKRATGQRLKGSEGGSQASSPSPATSHQGDDSAQSSLKLTSHWQSDESGAEYSVGDMLWGRVPGHPYWPCMVAPDPNLLSYNRLVQRGQKSSVRQYHVQFFGDEEERGWVAEPSTLKFEGRASFDMFCQKMIKEHKKD